MSAPAPGTALTFRAGGWVIVAAGLLCLALLGWALAGVFAGHRPKGGTSLVDYEFDLTSCVVPTDELLPTGQPRDFLRTLTVAETMPVADMVAFNAAHRKRYVVSDDRVIVVTVNGVTRVYPMLVVEAHEVVQDELGGVPIAVTYSPFCDAVSVFDRRVAGATLDLHVSGLVREANTVLYNTSTTALGESLWQQLDGRALSGPAAASRLSLTRIPRTFVTTWADVLRSAPDASVMKREEGNVRLYQNISYQRSHESPQIEFPVKRLPDPTGVIAPKSRVVVLRTANGSVAVPIDAWRERGKTSVEVEVPTGGARVTIELPAVAGTARVSAPDGVDIIPTFWFAAHALLGLDENSIAPPVPAG